MGRGQNTDSRALSFEAVADRRAKAADLPLKDFLAGAFKETVEAKRAELKAIEADYETFSRTAWVDRFPFEIVIDSSWAGHGEEGTSTVFHGTIKAAMKAACDEFKRVNNRSDVQGRFAVYVKLDNGTRISVPEDYWTEWRRYGYAPAEQIATLHKTIVETLANGPESVSALEQLASGALSEDDLELVDVTERIDQLIARQLIGWDESGKLALSEKGAELHRQVLSASSDDVRAAIWAHAA